MQNAGEYLDMVKKLCDVTEELQENFKAFFFFPKVIVISNCDISVIDVTGNNKVETVNNRCKILDSVMHDQFLWIIDSSGQLIVKNILEGSSVSICITNDAAYKIQKMKIIDECLYLNTDSGESLFCSLKLMTDTSTNETEISVMVEKQRNKSVFQDFDGPYYNISGLTHYIKANKLMVECPLTGLNVNVAISEELTVEHICSFNGELIIADKVHMLALDKNFNIVYKNQQPGVKLYPLKPHDSKFYYITYTEKEIYLGCIQKPGILNPFEKTEGNLNISIKDQQPEETLKSQSIELISMLLEQKIETAVAFDQLKSIIEKLSDLIFIFDNIVLKLFKHITLCKSLLNLLKERIHKSKNNDLIFSMWDIMFKFDLLEHINLKNNTLYTDLYVFDKNCKDLCVCFLKNCDFDLASICWLKYVTLNVVLTPDDILDILNSVPCNSKLGAIIIWLKKFVPPLIEENPFNLDIFVRWTTERVFNLENTTYWPKIGIKILDEILRVLETSFKSISVRPISIDDLDILKDRITDIMELKDKYKINILLRELSTLKSSEIALIMLRRCYLEDLESLLQNYMSTYALKYSLDLDVVLRSYIETEAIGGGGNIDGARLIILLNAFRIPSSKLDCLLQVLRILDVPWHNTISDLAKTSANLTSNEFTYCDIDRKLIQEIKEEINYAKLKVVLKKHNYPLTSKDYLSVLHKIVNAPVVDVHDLTTVINFMTAYTNYGSLLYIERCLSDYNTKAALEYFLSLHEKDKRIVLKSVISKYEHLTENDEFEDKLVQRCFLDFFKGVDLLDNLHINTMENMYHLKNSYNVKMNLNRMYQETSFQKFNIDEFTYGREKCIVKLLNHDCYNSSIFSTVQKVSMPGHIRKVIDNVVSLFTLMGSVSYTQVTKILSNCGQEVQDSSLTLLQLHKVIVFIATKCSEEYLFHMVSFMSIVHSLINASVVLRNVTAAWKFHYIYMPLSYISAENDLMQIFSSQSIAKYFEGSIIFKSDVIPLRLLPVVMATDIEKATNIKESFISNTVLKIISKLVTSQDSDNLFLMNLVLILQHEYDKRYNGWLSDVLRGQNETLSAIAVNFMSSTIAQRVFDFEYVQNGSPCQPLLILKTKYNMTLADTALPDITEDTLDVSMILYYVLRQQPNIAMERLVDICHSLNISIDDGLSWHLIAKLTTWNLEFNTLKDEFGRNKIHILNNESVLTNQCMIIWDSIRNKTFPKDILSDFWHTGEVTLHGRLVSINPYFYEVYLCIYQMIFASDIKMSKDYFLLNFLKDYTRKSAPQQYEFELFSIKGTFPEIGHYRLPFHMFMRDDMWVNLKSEITLETYELWLPAVSLLALDKDLQTAKDMICSNALKLTMKNRRFGNIDIDNPDNGSWRLSTHEEPLLRAAHRCVRHIANMEWAGACLFYVLQGCSRGADQVAAAQLCYHFAKKWEALQPGNRAVRKMERLHLTLSTRHALHKIEWAAEEFLQLLTEPTQLIRMMYQHPNFVEKMTRYDVNNAANEIADKNGINISTIRIQLLDNILEKRHDKNSRIVALDNNELLTAKYILKATCPKMGAIYLSRIAFDEESSFNKTKKLRALQCLMSIVDANSAIKVTNKEREQLWSELLELYYTIRLEIIDLPWAVESFLQNKSQAIDQVFAGVQNNSEGLRLIAELSEKYADARVIEKIVYALYRSGMHEQIAPLLLRILFPNSDILRSAWRAVLVTPFQSADYPITERQKVKCLNAINLLAMCPIIVDDYLLDIWKNCIRCKCYGIGCLTLPYMTDESRLNLKELKMIDKRNLISSLKNLGNETFLASGALHVVENMLSRSLR